MRQNLPGRLHHYGKSKRQIKIKNRLRLLQGMQLMRQRMSGAGY